MGLFANLDLVDGQLIEQPVHGGFLSWYAGVASAAQAATLSAWLGAGAIRRALRRASGPPTSSATATGAARCGST